MLILLMCDGFIKLKWFHTLGVFLQWNYFAVLSNRRSFVWNERFCLLVFHIYPNNISSLLLLHPTNSHRKSVTTWCEQIPSSQIWFCVWSSVLWKRCCWLLKRWAVLNGCKSSVSAEKCLSKVSWGSFTFICTCSRRHSMFCIPGLYHCFQSAAGEAGAGPDSPWVKWGMFHSPFDKPHKVVVSTFRNR